MIKRFLNTRGRIVPGSDDRKLRAALKLRADNLTYDLEDSVPLNRKGHARQLVFDALEHAPTQGEKAVRINGIGSGQEIDDLNVILRSSHLQAIVIPKVHSQKEIQFVARMIESLCPAAIGAQIQLIACIESAQGILNLKEIATADPRVSALLFAAEDYSADTGLLRTPSGLEMVVARQSIVNTAAAYHLQSIDMVCVDYKDPSILSSECKVGREFGFTGKQAIHPSQIDIIQTAFAPHPNDVAKASAIVKGYLEHSQRGIGAFELNGKMIDMPVVRWAERLLAKDAFIKSSSL